MALVATSEAIKIGKDDTTQSEIKKITESANAVSTKIESSTEETLGASVAGAADAIREMGKKAIEQQTKEASYKAKDEDYDDDEEAKPAEKKVSSKKAEKTEETSSTAKKIDQVAEENIRKIQ